MHLYTYVSLAVVVLSTATLYIILRRNKSKDCRYIIGLGTSAIVAIIASLLLPDIVSAFTVDLAMQLALSFFIAFLIYITLLFFSMMLVAYIFPQKKIDELKKKWEQKRLEKQESKELKQKQKEEARESQLKASAETEYKVIESETESGKSEIIESEIISDNKQQEEIISKPEPILKSIFINRFFRQKAAETPEDTVSADNEKSLASDSVKDEIPAPAGNVYEEQLTDTDVDINKDVEQESAEQESIEQEDTEKAGTGQESIEREDAEQEIIRLESSEQEEVRHENTEKEDIVYEDLVQAPDIPEETAETGQEAMDFAIEADEGTLEKAEVGEIEPVYDSTEVYPDEEPLEPAVIEPSAEADIFDQAVLTMEQAIDDSTGDEKNVDTQDIIDKMGLDEISDESVPYLDLNGLSLNDLINEAFLLKQKGRDSEAASLYIEALNRNPDNEAAFWIVLDICSIYKRSGQSELAEDILLTYIDEFEHLMSEEVKDQILQSLY